MGLLFAPVVNWTTVRLMVVLFILLNLSTKKIDYTAAFVHAPIDRDPNWDNLTDEQKARSGVYITMPRGFTQDGKVLKLKKSLYGLKQSPRNFFKILKSKLELVGFKSVDDIDPVSFSHHALFASSMLTILSSILQKYRTSTKLCFISANKQWTLRF
jgi:Reverse transcriptase (RNA-dependent DNA polymerase)